MSILALAFHNPLIVVLHTLLNCWFILKLTVIGVILKAAKKYLNCFLVFAVVFLIFVWLKKQRRLFLFNLILTQSFSHRLSLVNGGLGSILCVETRTMFCLQHRLRHYRIHFWGLFCLLDLFWSICDVVCVIVPFILLQLIEIRPAYSS